VDMPLSVSIRGHKGKSERGGRKSGEDSGQAANCRAEMVSERQKARQFAACPKFCVCRSRLRRCSGTPRPDGRLAGIRMAYLRRWASLPRSRVGARDRGCGSFCSMPRYGFCFRYGVLRKLRPVYRN